MRYLSTRGDTDQPRRQFCDILLEGLAPDGGLYLPEAYPHVDTATLAHWRTVLATQGYAALATAILDLFIDDIAPADLARLAAEAYTAQKFGTTDIVPASPLAEGLWLGHLSNGPTAAFKDMAMQLLGQLFEFELERQGSSLNIVGATSGDTGSSAEYAMLGKQHVRTFMLTPRGRMTPFQQAQMFSLDDPRIINVAIDGVFDDCQDLVKAISADADFKKQWSIGAVNSINWARLVAQVVYYVALWLRVSTNDDERVSFSVPTGNFGDVFAGHVARQMGVPIDALIVATNENNVLDEFFRTGVYRVRSAAQTHATSSPSMDISRASNFERFIFDLLGRDGHLTRDLFARRLASEGYFDLSGDERFAAAADQFGFLSGSSTHADRVATIADVHQRDGIIIDPHTADAVKVARELTAAGRVTTPVIVLETALPVKFADTIAEALGVTPEVPAKFGGIESLPRHVVELDNDVQQVKGLIVERISESS